MSEQFTITLDHMQIAMPEGQEQVARRFYGVLLGLPEVAKPTTLAGRGGVWFRCGGHEIHLGIERPFQPARKAHPGFLVANLEQLRQRLIQAGIDVQDDENRPGYRRFYVSDPFGNRLEFATRMDCFSEELWVRAFNEYIMGRLRFGPPIDWDRRVPVPPYGG